MGIRDGDRVRIHNGGVDEGRIGRVAGIADWYGRTMLMVIFEDARWDEPEVGWYDVSDVEMPDMPAWNEG